MSHGGHSGRLSAERQLSEPGPPALTPAAVSLVNKYSQQIVGNMQLQLAEMSKELLASTLTEKEDKEEHLKEERETLQWKHAMHVTEIHHNHKVTIAEMKACWEAEMSKALADLRKKMTVEKEEAVTATKKKQWCTQCWKEAIYYCCWNTSYCSYSCQQQHWSTHQVSCRQILDTTTATTTLQNAANAATPTTATSTVMVASTTSPTGFVSLRPTVIDKGVVVANDGVLTQAYKVQKPNTTTVNVVPGGDVWRSRLPQNIQFFPTQLPVSTTQPMRLVARPNQPLQRFQYVSNLGPGSQPAYQPSPLIHVMGQRPMVNMNIPSSGMMFPIMPQQQQQPSSTMPTPTLHK